MKKLLATLAMALCAFVGLGAGTVANRTSNRHYDRTIYVLNASHKVTDDKVKDYLPAFQAAVEDFEHYWGGSIKLEFTKAPPKGAVVIRLQDGLDVPAYGYHWFDGNGVPYAKVDVEASGKGWSITLTHELFEMLADPHVTRSALVAGKTYLIEVADPVEGNQFTYEHSSASGTPVKISDFVTPAWYFSGQGGTTYDYTHHVQRPLQLLEDGYVSYWTPDGWEQNFA